MKWQQVSLIILTFLQISIAKATMVVTYRVAESKDDTRYNYDTAALRLALEKTKAEFGDYKLVPGAVMNFSRAISDIKNNQTPNYIFKLSYESRFKKDLNLDYAEFPVDLGIVGYRVCFTNPKTKEKLKNVKSLDDLKKFKHGQGQDWSDVEILRGHGFEVITAANYESLFLMVAAGRFDLFCRGTNELGGEYEAHKHMPNLVYDESFSLYYPLPRFFYTNKANKELIKRIEKGLITAFNDGSLKELWKKEYIKSVNFVNLKNRKIFPIENPNLKEVKFNYKKYFFNPLE